MSGRPCSLPSECPNGICRPVSSDGCRFDCSAVEPGFSCPETGGPCLACGDGIRQNAEVCDDGNSVGGDGCSDDCLAVEPGFACPVAGAACEQCGNGIKESSETCDDGGRCGGTSTGARCRADTECAPGEHCLGVGGDGCSDRCQLESGYQCPVPGRACERCGDGVVDPNETCDDSGRCGGVVTGARCTTDAGCAASVRCLPVDGDGCNASCTAIDTDYRCPTAGQPCVKCGDGQVGPGEVCDDGGRCAGRGHCPALHR